MIFGMHPAVAVGLGILGYQGLRILRNRGGPDIEETEQVGSDDLNGGSPSFLAFLTGKMGVDRYPTDIHEVASEDHFTRHPEFINLADYSKGRFIRWEPPTEADRADDARRGLRRMRYSQDTTIFWFFRTSRELVTPCVFDPELDVEFIPPGTKPGIPLEGLLILKRSLNGKHLAREAMSRAVMHARDMRQMNELQADAIQNLLSLERLRMSQIGSEHWSSEMEKMIKNNSRVMRELGGRGGPQPAFGGGMGYSDPYGEEIYGTDGGAYGAQGAEGAWRLEG